MAEMWELDWNRLPLGWAVNVRDMGGYPTQDGGRTNYHRFVRGCVLFEANAEICDFLYKYGVRTMIDLRGDTEYNGAPPTQIAPDVEMHHVPLYEFNIADLDNVHLNDVFYEGYDPELTDVYRQMLDQGRDSIGKVFKIMAAAPEGCIFFNCTVGKDRTGIVAFLLMMLSGCDMQDCIANYVPSRTHLMRYPVVCEMLVDPNVSERRRAHVDSVYESGEFIYRFIEDECGGIENYLMSAGVTRDEAEKVRQRLIG